MPGDQRTQEVIDRSGEGRPAANDHYENRQKQDHDLDPNADGAALIDLVPLPDAHDVLRVHVEPETDAAVTVHFCKPDGTRVTSRDSSDNPDYASSGGADIFVSTAVPAPAAEVQIESTAGTGTQNQANWTVYSK